MSKQENLENLVKAQGALFSSDLHGNYNLISSGLEHANDNNLVYVVNGDIVNDYGFKSIANNLEIYSPKDIQMQYFQDKLSKQDLETLIVAQNASQYGLDAMLSQVPQEHKEEVKNQLEQVLEYAQSELFQKRFEKVSQDLINEKGEELQENGLKLRALYDVFMDEEAKRFADELNKYSDVKVLFNKGNHENIYFVEQVRQYLENQDQIVDLTALNDVYTIEDEIGNKTNIAGITNCVQFMPYLHEIFSSEELGHLYSHGFQEKYELEGKEVDILTTHGQIGIPTGIRNPIEVPYLDSAKKIGLEAKLIVEGHIHNKFEGKNSYGVDMIRVAGEEVAVVKKDINGNLNTEWVKLGSEYNGGHHNEVPYTNEYLSMRVEDMLKQYKLMMANSANDNTLDTSSESKAA